MDPEKPQVKGSVTQHFPRKDDSEVGEQCLGELWTKMKPKRHRQGPDGGEEINFYVKCHGKPLGGFRGREEGET